MNVIIFLVGIIVGCVGIKLWEEWVESKNEELQNALRYVKTVEQCTDDLLLERAKKVARDRYEKLFMTKYE